MNDAAYEKLVAWQKAHQVALDVYRLTAQFPSDEKFGLISQLRRAAVSAPSIIVEGFYRWKSGDKARHYNIAEASLGETHYQLRLAHDLGFADTSEIREQIDETRRVTAGLASSVRPKP